MTRPQWVQERIQQGEAALWSGKQDNVTDSGSSSHALPPEEVQLPLHATLQPSLEHIEDFLADQSKGDGDLGCSASSHYVSEQAFFAGE